MEIKSTELALGPHAGLIIKEAKHPRLNGMKLVEVTHKRIEGFCARAVVSLSMTTVEVFELFKKEVRLSV
ncbi:protein NnrU [Vibrio phage vB_VpaS_1601]|uniref:protein NnrU n=1 Tax=Vibrio phage SHOU24 TaxID=1414739 RepID=UPI0003ED251F|nr:protein NnrU [Vibrio phage SHOU24]AHI61282.1 protein NnrU [Vibrio phage SHOU24]WHM52694.1 protein NnrU [Vibrio phage vB_VpaP_1601]WHM52782.1 protein NnrU [Vibrio phage vB_VpaP_1601]